MPGTFTVPLPAPFPSNAFWIGAGGNCEAYNQGDPIILYDEVGDLCVRAGHVDLLQRSDADLLIPAYD